MFPSSNHGVNSYRWFHCNCPFTVGGLAQVKSCQTNNTQLLAQCPDDSSIWSSRFVIISVHFRQESTGHQELWRHVARYYAKWTLSIESNLQVLFSGPFIVWLNLYTVLLSCSFISGLWTLSNTINNKYYRIL